MLQHKAKKICIKTPSELFDRYTPPTKYCVVCFVYTSTIRERGAIDTFESLRAAAAAAFSQGSGAHKSDRPVNNNNNANNTQHKTRRRSAKPRERRDAVIRKRVLVNGGPLIDKLVTTCSCAGGAGIPCCWQVRRAGSQWIVSFVPIHHSQSDRQKGFGHFPQNDAATKLICSTQIAMRACDSSRGTTQQKKGHRGKKDITHINPLRNDRSARFFSRRVGTPTANIVSSQSRALCALYLAEVM